MNTNLTSSLTNDQKAAALTALKFIGLWASMDIADTEDLLPKFANRLNINFELLSFNPNNTLLSKYENEDSEDILFMTLHSMPANTKPWFVVESYMMVAAAGEISQRAMQITLLYCEKMGIPEKQYLEIIQKAYIVTGGM